MSERQMTIILLCVMGAIVLLGAGALYWLQFQELATLEEELAQVTAKVDDAQKKKAAIPGLETRKKTLTETIERIRGQIPLFNPKEENDAFADAVDHLRKKCRVTISGARYSAARTGQGEPSIPAGIFRARYEYRVTGGFYQLLNFMNHLETERRFLVLDGIKLGAGTVVEGRGLAPVRELVLNISTFLQRPSGPVPGAVVEAKPAEKPPGEATDEPRRLTTPVPD